MDKGGPSGLGLDRLFWPLPVVGFLEPAVPIGNAHLETGEGIVLRLVVDQAAGLREAHALVAILRDAVHHGVVQVGVRVHTAAQQLGHVPGRDEGAEIAAVRRERELVVLERADAHHQAGQAVRLGVDMANRLGEGLGGPVEVQRPGDGILLHLVVEGIAGDGLDRGGQHHPLATGRHRGLQDVVDPQQVAGQERGAEVRFGAGFGGQVHHGVNAFAGLPAGVRLRNVKRHGWHVRQVLRHRGGANGQPEIVAVEGVFGQGDADPARRTCHQNSFFHVWHARPAFRCRRGRHRLHCIPAFLPGSLGYRRRGASD